jgi:hypothetical protein
MPISLIVAAVIQSQREEAIRLRLQLAEALAAEPDADAAVAAEAAAHAAAEQLPVPEALMERLQAAPGDAMAQLEALEAFVASLPKAES